MSIQKIVQPFQGQPIFEARRLPPGTIGGTPLPPPTLEWEGSAEAKWNEEDPEMTINFKAEWEEDKSKRDSKLVKIVNPDDEDQHIFTERVNKFTFNNKLTGKEQTFKFDWTSPLDGGT